MIFFLDFSSNRRPERAMSLEWSHSGSSFFDFGCEVSWPFECICNNDSGRFFLYDRGQWGRNPREIRDSRTLCSATALWITSSVFCRFRASKALRSPSSGTSEFSFRRFFPDSSSAILCCRSAGVSVHNVVSVEPALGLVVGANFRPLVNRVGSMAVSILSSVSRMNPRECDGAGTYILVSLTLREAPASTPRV